MLLEQSVLVPRDSIGQVEIVIPDVSLQRSQWAKFLVLFFLFYLFFIEFTMLDIYGFYGSWYRISMYLDDKFLGDIYSWSLYTGYCKCYWFSLQFWIFFLIIILFNKKKECVQDSILKLMLILDRSISLCFYIIKPNVLSSVLFKIIWGKGREKKKCRRRSER